MSQEDIVVGIIALNGGRVVGKTRLQKIVYLLEFCGMSAGFNFGYHNFGPFSVDVARAADDAVFTGRVEVSVNYGFHDVPYSVFETDEELPSTLGDLSADQARQLLEKMKPYSAIHLELAATMVFLEHEEEFSKETVKGVVQDLKPVKATEERLEKAEQLLSELGVT